MLLSTDMFSLNPCWSGEIMELIEGVMLSRMIAEIIRLSVLLTTRGRVSSTQSVGFLGRTKSKPPLNSGGGGPSHNGEDAREEHIGRDVGSGPENPEGDPVRTNRGVVGRGNNSVDKLQGDVKGFDRNTLTVNFEEFGNVTSRVVELLVFPEGGDDTVKNGRIRLERTIHVLEGSDNIFGGWESLSKDVEFVPWPPRGGLIGVGGKLSVNKVEEGGGVTIRRN